MKELETEFTGSGEVAGFTFKQIAKSDLGFVYEVNDEGRKHYEVFERKESKESDGIISGVPVHFEAKVRYPKANDFGEWAWSVRTRERAFEIFLSFHSGNIKIHAISPEVWQCTI